MRDNLYMIDLVNVNFEITYINENFPGKMKIDRKY